MLVEKGDRNDVAIYWPKTTYRSRAINSILRTGKCPSLQVPRQLRPGGLVALVEDSGAVILVFRVARVKEGAVVWADGKRYERGCILFARKGSIRRPKHGDPKSLRVNRNAPGAFAYFDAKTGKRVVYSLKKGVGASNDTPKRELRFPPREYPLFADNIGKALSQPERRLIEAYVNWIGNVAMFAHHPLKQSGLYTDLFIPSRWTLIEAKASTARRTLREAIGQLFDYQRYYDRSPRLAILLPRSPSAGLLELFSKKKIAVVWKSRGGSFRDSAEGALTHELKRQGAGRRV